MIFPNLLHILNFPLLAFLNCTEIQNVLIVYENRTHFIVEHISKLIYSVSTSFKFLSINVDKDYRIDRTLENHYTRLAIITTLTLDTDTNKLTNLFGYSDKQLFFTLRHFIIIPTKLQQHEQLLENLMKQLITKLVILFLDFNSDHLYYISNKFRHETFTKILITETNLFSKIYNGAIGAGTIYSIIVPTMPYVFFIERSFGTMWASGHIPMILHLLEKYLKIYKIIVLAPYYLFNVKEDIPSQQYDQLENNKLIESSDRAAIQFFWVTNDEYVKLILYLSISNI